MGSPSLPKRVVVSTAALIRAIGGRIVRRCFRNSRKFVASSELIWFPKPPSFPGYSQSISIPSSSKARYVVRMFLANVFLFFSVATAVEKCLK